MKHTFHPGRESAPNEPYRIGLFELCIFYFIFYVEKGEI